MEKKLRYSRQREEIYQYLCSSHEHPSAETIYQELREKVEGLSLGTVYRNLHLLEELGKIRKVTNYQNTDRYDVRCADHVHFICQSCHRILDLPEVQPEEIRSMLHLGQDYKLLQVDLTLSGLCPQCRTKERKEEQDQNTEH